MLRVDESPTARQPRIAFGACHRLGRRLLLLGSRRLPVPAQAVLPGGVMSDLANLLQLELQRYETAARAHAANFQDGYWLMFAAAPLAVVCAAVGATWGGEHVLSGIELALMLGTVGLFATVRRRGWRDQWVRARRTAEYLRYLPLLAPYVTDWSRNWYEQLAQRHGSPSMPDPQIDRICRRLDQAPALHGLSFKHYEQDPGYRAYVIDLLRQQAAYHAIRAAEEHTLTRRIGALSTALFALTIVATLLIFVRPLAPQALEARFFPAAEVLRFLATVLPAVGAALRGLLAQSESHRLATLSDALTARLQDLIAQIESVQPAEHAAAQTHMELLVWATVQELLSETDTWMRLQSSVPLSMGS